MNVNERAWIRVMGQLLFLARAVAADEFRPPFMKSHLRSFTFIPG